MPIADDMKRAAGPLSRVEQDLENEGVPQVAIGCCLMIHSLLYLEDNIEAEHMIAIRALLVQSQERVTALLMRYEPR